jgi:hypothetical protein
VIEMKLGDVSRDGDKKEIQVATLKNELKCVPRHTNRVYYCYE